MRSISNAFPVVSGVLLGLSYLPGPFLLLNFTAFLPFLVWLDARPTASAYVRFRGGFVFGLVTFMIVAHFMYAMLEFSWLAAVLYVGLTVGLGVRVALFATLLGWLRRRTGLAWGILLPLCWIPSEWLQSWGDLRMTADNLANGLSQYPFLLQFLDLTGPYGVGAMLLAINGLLFDCIRSSRRDERLRPAIAIALLAAAALAYDTWAWNRDDPQGETVRVAIVQPNIPLRVKHSDETGAQQWSTLVELSSRAAAARPDLIVWPETARPLPLLHRPGVPDSFAMGEVQELAGRLETDMLVGVDYVRFRADGGYDRFNAAMGVDRQGRLLKDWGAKVYLVPFTEGVPFESVLGPLVDGRGGEWNWLAGGFRPGPQSALLDLAGSRVGALVCYEQLFSDLARDLRNRGAEFQIVITNDAWFGRSFFQRYLVNVLRMRAIENRTDYVRVANTGISGFVDRKGRYSAQTALFEEAVQVGEVHRAGALTPYNRAGDVVAWVAVAALIGLCVLARTAPPGSAPGDGARRGQG